MRRRRRSWPRWMLVGLVLVLFTAVLGINGLVHGPVGRDAHAGAPGPDDRVPEAVLNGGPGIDASGPRVRSYSVRPKTIALTFDDGPDPRWTRRILDVLDRHDVPATFFVVGSLVARYPELVERIEASGSEIGLHTFTHADLPAVSDARVRAELAESQLALAGATGTTTYLLRPPYSSFANAVDNAHLAEIRATSKQGYLTVLSTTDSKDWKRPGAARIVANATPPPGQGAIVLMHDAGGDRSQTVAALKSFIPRMQARGYRFTTVTEALGLPPSGEPAAAPQRIAGEVFLTAVALSTLVVDGLGIALLLIGVLIVLRLLLMLVVATRHRRQRRHPGFSWGPPVTEAVSVIVPAHNEAASITATVRSLMTGTHPLEVIVVDDGSTDGTAEMVGALQLPTVRVLRQPNSGKSAALNTGIACARHEIVVMIDADTIVEPETVRELVAPFARQEVGAVAGYARVTSRRGLLAACQHLEYVVGFGIDRRVYDLARCMPTIPGAVGAFRRRVLVEVGGLTGDTLAEDTDLTMAISRSGWRVVYQPSARAHTEAPGTVRDLWKQRYRWCYGTMQAMWKHRAAVLTRGPEGRFGRLGLAHLALFQILLPLLSPLIDIYLVYGLVFLDPVTTAAAWLTMLALQTLAACYACRTENEPLRVVWLIPLQQIFYRQLSYLVVIQSALTALRGLRLHWQTPHRSGTLHTHLSAYTTDGNNDVTDLTPTPRAHE